MPETHLESNFCAISKQGERGYNVGVAGLCCEGVKRDGCRLEGARQGRRNHQAHILHMSAWVHMGPHGSTWVSMGQHGSAWAGGNATTRRFKEEEKIRARDTWSIDLAHTTSTAQHIKPSQTKGQHIKRSQPKGQHIKPSQPKGQHIKPCVLRPAPLAPLVLG